MDQNHSRVKGRNDGGSSREEVMDDGAQSPRPLGPLSGDNTGGHHPRLSGVMAIWVKLKVFRSLTGSPKQCRDVLGCVFRSLENVCASRAGQPLVAPNIVIDFALTLSRSSCNSHLADRKALGTVFRFLEKGISQPPFSGIYAQ